MSFSNQSIFKMNEPPMWRILGANVLVWMLATGFWWRTLEINGVEGIPSSRRFGPLTSDIAIFLGLGFFVCACWALMEIKKAGWRKWPMGVRFGLLSAIAGIFANAAAMAAAAQRIWEIGS